MLNEEDNSYLKDTVQENFIVNEPHEFYDGKRDFTSLKVWIKCRKVKLFFYKQIIPLLPKEEKFNLDIQIRKASVSITANISEACLRRQGYGRYHYKEGVQFYLPVRSGG